MLNRYWRHLIRKTYQLQLKNASSTPKKTDFIGFIIKPEQISMDLKKIKAIVN